jgi:hypothetical protein
MKSIQHPGTLGEYLAVHEREELAEPLDAPAGQPLRAAGKRRPVVSPWPWRYCRGTR